MKFGSLFSGIGGFDKGLEDAGMECAYQCEFDKHANDVLEYHWPNVKRYEDVRDVGKTEPVDLICGGFPCQDLSVAGKRKGLAGWRSGLWFEFHRIIEINRPRWVVIENVPGLLSSNGGGDFAVILRGLVELGYGVAWRVLDSQYFGVAQRRRRVFIVGHLGGGGSTKILFECESGVWDSPPSREAGEGIARSLTNRPGRSHREDKDTFIPQIYQWASGGGDDMKDTAQTLRSGAEANYQFVAFNIQQNDGGNHKRKDRPNGGMYVNETEQSLTLGSTDKTVVAFNARRTEVVPIENISSTLNPGGGGSQSPGVAYALNSRNNRLDAESQTLIAGLGVRRLTPTECERLQGFPDGWTIGSDTQRYKQLGNAVTVPVARWIGKRIMTADNPPTNGG